ncbi:MAG TPA: Uma2 family endonuclease [Gemmatimonadales bacterium]|nr:Uma2 family endonuclease [Gemmatimonadales bacterium]
MPDTLRRYTADEVLAFPSDGNRYEVVDGELLVTPSPAAKHQIVLARLLTQLTIYLAPHERVAIGIPAPADIIRSEHEYVQPDLFVVPRAEVTGDWRDCRTLLLAVEIVSPSSARGDRLKKRRLYQRRGVATYWVVDPDAQLIEVWHPDDTRPEIIADIAHWRLTPDLPEMVVDLSKLFAELPG